MNNYLLVDGYNIINAWDKFKKIAVKNLEEARDLFIQEIIDYKFYTGQKIIVVFDAHQVKSSNNRREVIKGVDIIFTKEHQTADSYIEKTVEKLTQNRRNNVRVATSDWAEQQVVLGSGATRISAREFIIEIEMITSKIKIKTSEITKNRVTLEERIDKNVLKTLEKWRRNTE